MKLEEHKGTVCMRTSFLCIASVDSFNTSHFGLHSQLTNPSSFTLTTPQRTTCAFLRLSDVLFGEPPMPELEDAEEELEGDDVPTENVLEYVPFILEGAEGAGRVGVNEAAVT